jgi:hypothetical protein
MIQKTLAFIDVETTGTKVLKHAKERAKFVEELPSSL